MLCVFAQEGDYRYNMMEHLHILTEGMECMAENYQVDG
jgi:hypothetical protein